MPLWLIQLVIRGMWAQVGSLAVQPVHSLARPVRRLDKPEEAHFLRSPVLCELAKHQFKTHTLAPEPSTPSSSGPARNTLSRRHPGSVCGSRHVLSLIFFSLVACKRPFTSLISPTIVLSREARCFCDRPLGQPSTGYGACDPRYPRRDSHRPPTTPSVAPRLCCRRDRTLTRLRRSPRREASPPL